MTEGSDGCDEYRYSENTVDSGLNLRSSDGSTAPSTIRLKENSYRFDFSLIRKINAEYEEDSNGIQDPNNEDLYLSSLRYGFKLQTALSLARRKAKEDEEIVDFCTTQDAILEDSDYEEDYEEYGSSTGTRAMEDAIRALDDVIKNHDAESHYLDVESFGEKD